MVDLGIVDIREVFKIVQKQYGFDLSNFALTSFKYRLEYIMAKNNLGTVDALIYSLKEKPSFFHRFIAQLSVPSTEMFRDPSLWRWLREEHFSKLEEKHLLNYKIWLPNCSSGGELFSLCILLKEMELLDKVKIFATSWSQENIDFIKSGEYNLKKIEISKENYVRFQGDNKMDDYFQKEGYKIYRDKSLIEKVEFICDDISYANAPRNVKIILMRNALIYYNPNLQREIMLKMYEQMSVNGLIVLGTGENIESDHTTISNFDRVTTQENVYKRKFNGG